MPASSPKAHLLLVVGAIGLIVLGVFASVRGFVFESKPLEGVLGLLSCAIGLTQLLFPIAQRRSTRAGDVVALLGVLVGVALGVTFLVIALH